MGKPLSLDLRSRLVAAVSVSNDIGNPSMHCLTLIATGLPRCLRWFATGRTQDRGAAGGGGRPIRVKAHGKKREHGRDPFDFGCGSLYPV